MNGRVKKLQQLLCFVLGNATQYHDGYKKKQSTYSDVMELLLRMATPKFYKNNDLRVSLLLLKTMNKFFSKQDSTGDNVKKCFKKWKEWVSHLGQNSEEYKKNLHNGHFQFLNALSLCKRDTDIVKKATCTWPSDQPLSWEVLMVAFVVEESIPVYVNHYDVE